MPFVKTRRQLVRGFWHLGLATLIAGGFAARPSQAAANSPAAFVQAFADEVSTALRDRSRPRAQRLQAVDAVVGHAFALDRIARIALGRHWRGASAAERSEFAELFKAAVLASYSRRFDDYADRRVRVGGATATGEQFMVASQVEGGSKPVRLDWRVAQIDGRWRILDVMVEGVSLTLTYRNEFAAVIEQGGGVGALIAELRSRASAGGPEATG